MTARGAAAAAMAALLLPVTALWTARAVCPGDSVQPASGTPRLAGSPPRLCATFSIVAIDTATGEAGVAVQSHWF
ncbi:MAG: hypothetical protein QUU85_11880, partial [Candidatus Eisenbacteria bacterium]|nr:hypothetical protein [Candidatus Eisenbacteria bacterium]